MTILNQSLVFFFVLSGFLVYLAFVRSASEGRPLPPLGRYALNRIRRIYPAYIAIFMVANFAFGAVYVVNAFVRAAPGTDSGSGRISDPLRLLEHLSLLQNLVPSEVQTGINTSWPLTTELSFYVVVPCLISAVMMFARHRGGFTLSLAVAPGLFLLAVGIASKFVTGHLQERQGLSYGASEFGPNWVAVISRSLLEQADHFAVGMLVAVIYVWISRGELSHWTPERVRWCSSAVLVVSVASAVYCLHRTSRFEEFWSGIASGAFVLLIVEPNARGRVSSFAAWCDVLPLRYLGKISLSLYLVHYPVILLVARWNLYGPDSVVGATWSLFLVGAVSILLAMALYYLVERPAIEWSPRKRRAGRPGESPRTRIADGR